jgi:hypothetical protein
MAKKYHKTIFPVQITSFSQWQSIKKCTNIFGCPPFYGWWKFFATNSFADHPFSNTKYFYYYLPIKSLIIKVSFSPIFDHFSANKFHKIAHNVLVEKLISTERKMLWGGDFGLNPQICVDC